jgi:pyruvate dehydrogenase E1 component beta subunit
MGEDVGLYGGCYAVTKGLLDEFGPSASATRRLPRAPSSAPASARRWRGCGPIVEIMTCNFSLLALDQIINNAATIPHMSGGQFAVPLVIRMATGGGASSPPSIRTAWKAGSPTFPASRCWRPGTIEDARYMLKAALADPNPVLIFEHIVLYNAEGELDPAVTEVDIARRRSAGPGATSASSPMATACPRRWRRRRGRWPEGIEAEVVDLRVLRPLDDATIFELGDPTRRCIIVDEGWKERLDLRRDRGAARRKTCSSSSTRRSAASAAARCRSPMPPTWRRRRCRRRRPSSRRAKRW